MNKHHTQLDLTIIIVNFNGGDWLKTTLKSLKQQYLSQTQLQVAVMVVDNASTDDSVTYLQRQNWLELLELPENVGFAAGNNQALHRVLQRKLSRYVLLLNSDTELDARSNLDHLVEYLDQNSTVAVVTPQLVLSDGSLDPACHRGEPTPWAALTYFSGLESLFPRSTWLAQYHQTYLDLSQPHAIAACSGAAMMVRVSAIQKVGLLDERFFMYAEDLDWCHRFRTAGFEVHYLPTVTVIHHKNKSGVEAAHQQTSLAARNHFYETMLQYFDKHYKLKYPSFMRHLVKWVVNIKKGVS